MFTSSFSCSTVFRASAILAMLLDILPLPTRVSQPAAKCHMLSYQIRNIKNTNMISQCLSQYWRYLSLSWRLCYHCRFCVCSCTFLNSRNSWISRGKNLAHLWNWYQWVCAISCSLIRFKGTVGACWRHVLCWVSFYRVCFNLLVNSAPWVSAASGTGRVSKEFSRGGEPEQPAPGGVIRLLRM